MILDSSCNNIRSVWVQSARVHTIQQNTQYRFATNAEFWKQFVVLDIYCISVSVDCVLQLYEAWYLF
jgi:hypothetical protein